MWLNRGKMTVIHSLGLLLHLTTLGIMSWGLCFIKSISCVVCVRGEWRLVCWSQMLCGSRGSVCALQEISDDSCGSTSAQSWGQAHTHTTSPLQGSQGSLMLIYTLLLLPLELFVFVLVKIRLADQLLWIRLHFLHTRWWTQQCISVHVHLIIWFDSSISSYFNTIVCIHHQETFLKGNKINATILGLI